MTSAAVKETMVVGQKVVNTGVRQSIALVRLRIMRGRVDMEWQFDTATPGNGRPASTRGRPVPTQAESL